MIYDICVSCILNIDARTAAGEAVICCHRGWASWGYATARGSAWLLHRPLALGPGPARPRRLGGRPFRALAYLSLISI